MEPIIAISVVIFLVASGAVVSMSIFGSYADEGDNLSVAPGRTVSVYYTGSLYGYYDEDGALIFDTNVREHAENDEYSKIGGLSKTSFVKLSFVQGKGEMLALFEEGLAGHKAGDVVKIKIDLGEGYPSKSIDRANSFEIPKEQHMTVKDFEAIYDDYVVEGAGPITIKTLYGWDALAFYDSAKKGITLIHMPTVGDEYELESNEKNTQGSVGLKVESIDTIDGEEILKCKYTVNVDGDGDYMLWVKTHSEEFYIHDVSGDKIIITDSPAAEGDIYFVVTIASVSE